MRLKAIWWIITSRTFVIIADPGSMAKYKTLSAPMVVRHLDRLRDTIKLKDEIEQEEYERQK